MSIERENLDSDIRETQRTGRVVWITGLSGAGKSVLAEALTTRLRIIDDKVLLLDGDDLREVFDASFAHDENYVRDKRMVLAMQYARLCNVLAKQGFTVVIATISLFKEIQTWNRLNLRGYFEVYLKVPIEELRRRDAKGLYRGFDAGEIRNVAGLDLPIDEPEFADLVFEFSPNRTVSKTVDELLNRLNRDRHL